jgi:cytochrome c peroxidase
MTPRARDGLARFFEVGCIQCHYGPLLTNDSFHNIAMPTGRRDGMPDQGRFLGVAALAASLFRADGAFSDAPTFRDDLGALAAAPAMLGQFHTPSLRATSATSPWGHGGTFAQMHDVMLHYAQRGDTTPVVGSTGTPDLHLGGFHRDEVYLGSLVDLMQAMTADPLLP